MVVRAAVGLVLACVGAARADLVMVPVFSDHMVLQRDSENPVWGKTDAGATITVKVADQVHTATAGADGKWRVVLKPMVATANPLELTVSDSAGHAIKFSDVLVGEVWLCSGQSNMDLRLGDARDGAKEVAAADHPQIRLFMVPQVNRIDEQEGLEGKAQWDVCRPDAARNFSAVGYFFGREIQQDLKVPVGLIKSSVGGTAAEAWTSRKGLEAEAGLRPLVGFLDKLKAEGTGKHEAWARANKEWEKQGLHDDPGNEGVKRGWADPKADDSYWPVMKMPQHWEKTGLQIDGSVWFRKTVDVPADWAGKELTLSIGNVDDFDVTYFDGEQVGATDKSNPWAVFVDRKYVVPGKLVKGGKATVAVRIFDRGGPGGMFSQDDNVYLEVKGDEKPQAATAAPAAARRIPLAGDWRWRIETPVAPYLEPRPSEPMWSGSANAPTALYNAMIRPIEGYGIRGVIWYQGESNAGRAEQYRTLFPAMIADWRRVWGRPELPFLFVQLSTWGLPGKEPGESDVAELREAQEFTARTVPQTGMATAVDLGQADGDIHPKNKQDVGHRLALAARAGVYGEKGVKASYPTYASMAVEGKAVRVRIANAGGGLKTVEGKGPGRFAIAGEDRKWRWAEARIDGDAIVVSSAAVERPVAVRYGWEMNPVVNVYGGDGLPLLPFRTDDWARVTAGRETP
jgi:sialate O-acetylesterase